MTTLLPDDMANVRSTVTSASLSSYDALGSVGITALLGITHGMWGLAAGACVLLTAALARSIAAFVVAELAVIALSPAGLTWPALVAQVAIAPLLVGTITSGRPSPNRLIMSIGAYVAMVGVVWALVTTLRWVWQAALVLVLLGGGVTYFIHRYERVALGLVSKGDDIQ